MTTLANRPSTALLVVDAQNGVVEGAHERDAIVANVSHLVDRARLDTTEDQAAWGAPPPEQVTAHTNDFGGPARGS